MSNSAVCRAQRLLNGSDEYFRGLTKINNRKKGKVLVDLTAQTCILKAALRMKMSGVDTLRELLPSIMWGSIWVA
jgi:hypothetical protein